MVLIAVFIFFAAQAEAADVASRGVAAGLRLRDAVITSFERLSPQDPMHVAAQVLIRTTQHEFPVVTQDGLLAGFLTREALFQAMATGQNAHPVGEAMVPVPALPLDAPLERALDGLATAPAVAAVDGAGRVLGYLTRENLGELIILRGVGRS